MTHKFGFDFFQNSSSMAGCNFHSEDTGDCCTCDGYELDPDSDSLKCSSCNHSEKVHSHSLPASTQQKPKKLEVMKLLKSLGKSGQFDEANNEANRNLVSKKVCFFSIAFDLIYSYRFTSCQSKKNTSLSSSTASSSSQHGRKSAGSSGRKSEHSNGPADGTFPVAQVALLFLGLELDVCRAYLFNGLDTHLFLICLGRCLSLSRTSYQI